MSRNGDPFVLVLSGPSGAGKSATAVAWAQAQPVVTACISHDQVRTLIRSGFASPETDRNERAAWQWDLAIRVCGSMVRRYLDASVRCILDVYRPPQPHDLWDKELLGVDARVVVLLPTYGVARDRNSGRDGHVVSESNHQRNYSNFEWCVNEYRPSNVIDNSLLTIEETVAAIDACLIRSDERTANA